jgi:hypothetical protein
MFESNAFSMICSEADHFGWVSPAGSGTMVMKQRAGSAVPSRASVILKVAYVKGTWVLHLDMPGIPCIPCHCVLLPLLLIVPITFVRRIGSLLIILSIVDPQG